jgi:uridine kinase
MSHGDPAETMLPDGEPWGGPWRSVTITDFAAELLRASPVTGRRPAIVAVDGRSASGKSTLAGGLAEAVPQAHLVHTDDVAWWHSFFDWVELMQSGVLEPVHRGKAVDFTPPAWTERGRQGAIVVPSGARLVVVEGVGAGRHELADLVDVTIWVQADEEARSAREAARIALGEVSAELVDEWQREERPFVARQRTWERADHVVAGGVRNDSHRPADDVLVGSTARAKVLP